MEKSLAVLSNLKDLEFHSRANIEKLAELSLTIEEELKQKAFADAIGAVLRRAGCISIQDPGVDRSLRDRVHSLVGFGLTSSGPRIFLQFFRAAEQSVSNNTESQQSKKEMKAKNLITVAVVSAGLLFTVAAQAKEEKHEEQTSTARCSCRGSTSCQGRSKRRNVVRWEKEGANYEAVIQKDGKRIGVEIDANGKVLRKHYK